MLSIRRPFLITTQLLILAGVIFNTSLGLNVVFAQELQTSPDALLEPVIDRNSLQTSERNLPDEAVDKPQKISNQKSSEMVDAPSVLLSISPLKNKNRMLAQSNSLLQSDFGLSNDAYQLADLWGLIKSLNEIRALKKPTSTAEMEDLVKRVVVRQEMSELILEKLFDIRKTLNTIDSQLSAAQAVKAQLDARRDKAIRFNTYADIVAGGITGILSGALRLGTLEFITPDVVDVAEGVAEFSLAARALKTENVQHKMESGVPNLLGKTIFPDHKHQNLFPDSVWMYLNSVPIGSKTNLTRREELVKKWTESHYCLVHKGHKKAKINRARHISGTQEGRPYITIDLLEDRIAMLEDLRTEINEMEELVAEIYQSTRKY